MTEIYSFDTNVMGHFHKDISMLNFFLSFFFFFFWGGGNISWTFFHQYVSIAFYSFQRGWFYNWRNSVRVDDFIPGFLIVDLQSGCRGLPYRTCNSPNMHRPKVLQAEGPIDQRLGLGFRLGLPGWQNAHVLKTFVYQTGSNGPAVYRAFKWY